MDKLILNKAKVTFSSIEKDEIQLKPKVDILPQKKPNEQNKLKLPPIKKQNKLSKAVEEKESKLSRIQQKI